MIPIENARVLVTGGAGFVGSNLVRRLIREGARVTVLDDLFTGRPEVVPTTVQLVKGSVVDEALVRELVADASVVFHLAARNIIASTKDPREDFATNIGGTLNVLLAAREQVQMLRMTEEPSEADEPVDPGERDQPVALRRERSHDPEQHALCLRVARECVHQHDHGRRDRR